MVQSTAFSQRRECGIIIRGKATLKANGMEQQSIIHIHFSHRHASRFLSMLYSTTVHIVLSTPHHRHILITFAFFPFHTTRYSIATAAMRWCKVEKLEDIFSNFEKQTFPTLASIAISLISQTIHQTTHPSYNSTARREYEEVIVRQTNERTSEQETTTNNMAKAAKHGEKCGRRTNEREKFLFGIKLLLSTICHWICWMKNERR